MAVHFFSIPISKKSRTHPPPPCLRRSPSDELPCKAEGGKKASFERKEPTDRARHGKLIEPEINARRSRSRASQKAGNRDEGTRGSDHIPLPQREAKQRGVAGHCRLKHLAEIEKGQRIHAAGCKTQQRQTDVPRVDVFLCGIDIRHVRRPNPIDRRCPRRPEILPRRFRAYSTNTIGGNGKASGSDCARINASPGA